MAIRGSNGEAAVKRWRVVVLVTLATALMVSSACSDGGDGRPEVAEFAGDWDVSLVVGNVDADPEADPATFPGTDTFREHWIIEDCDDEACTLSRPDGGFLLGDLDGVRLEYTTAGALEGNDQRFVGVGDARSLTAADPESESDPCAGSAAQRWSVRIEVDVRDSVLSGTVIRTPEAMRTEIEATTCFGLDLTLGFSGTPRAGVESGSSG